MFLFLIFSALFCVCVCVCVCVSGVEGGGKDRKKGGSKWKVLPSKGIPEGPGFYLYVHGSLSDWQLADSLEILLTKGVNGMHPQTSPLPALDSPHLSPNVPLTFYCPRSTNDNNH